LPNAIKDIVISIRSEKNRGGREREREKERRREREKGRLIDRRYLFRFYNSRKNLGTSQNL